MLVSGVAYLHEVGCAVVIVAGSWTPVTLFEPFENTKSRADVENKV